MQEVINVLAMFGIISLVVIGVLALFLLIYLADDQT